MMRIPLSNKTHIIGFYVCVVLIFAGVNYLIFRYDSTSYIISEQMNKHIDRYEFLNPDLDLASYHRNAKDEMPITIDGFSKLIKPLLLQLDTLNTSLSENGVAIDRYNSELDALLGNASAQRSDSIGRFIDKYLTYVNARIDSLKNYMAEKDSTEMIIAGVNMELARLEVEKAEENARLHKFVMSHYGSYIPDSTNLKIDSLSEKHYDAVSKNMVLEGNRRNLSDSIRTLTIQFHENRLNAITFWDFLYYSFCVSTTVSFGDIAPNNSLTRIVAVIELILCICIVGIILNMFTAYVRKRAS